MKLGLEVLVQKNEQYLKNKKIGILAHAASLDLSGRHAIDIIAEKTDAKIVALFGPEHGIAAKAQDMEPVDSSHDSRFGIPVHSLYGSTLESLSPKKHMLENLDVLVVDLQDIGSRYYTFVWTALLCLRACAKLGKKVIICDRPNPIGGTLVEGGPIAAGFESFVGLCSLPVRHGMTIGEIILHVAIKEGIEKFVEVIPMEGLKREMSWPDLGAKWTNPSPNMRSYNAALLYPGMCLLEATNISEGRGTDLPFEIVGAPYMGSKKFVEKFNKLKLKGVKAAPTSFIPVMQKWEGCVCHGVRWVVTEPNKFNSYLCGLVFLWLASKLYGKDGFKWRSAPYEFVADKPAIDLLTGSEYFRNNIDILKLDDLKQIATTPEEMMKERKKSLIYS